VADHDIHLELLRQVRLLAELWPAFTQRCRAVVPEAHAATVSLLAELGNTGECRIGELARRRAVDVSVVSRQVAQLEREGLVTRRPDPRDRRVSLVQATPAGREALARWREVCIRELRQTLSQDEHDIRAATGTLVAVNDWLRGALQGDTRAGASPDPVGRTTPHRSHEPTSVAEEMLDEHGDHPGREPERRRLVG